MKRRFVHLSVNFRIATEVGLRRTFHPAILEIDVEEARKDGIKFFKATRETYICKYVPSKYIRLVS
jgi:RNA:NAD 2'-phosphotransferase (TPT1/KptA family)